MIKHLLIILKRTHFHLSIITLIIAIIAVPLAYISPEQNSYALGSDYFTMSPTSGSYNVGSTLDIDIGVTASDQINGVAAVISYPTSSLQFNSSTLTGPFNLCGSNSGSAGTINIGCADSSGNVTGTQDIATESFTVLAAASNATVQFTTGTAISSSNQTNTWNGVYPSGSYTFVTPPSAPSAPSGVSAAPNGTLGQANVSWTAPSDGGATITQYTISPSPACGGCTGLTVTGGPPATNTLIGGLTGGKSYTFTVTATNSAGTSTASSPSNAITPASAPASKPPSTNSSASTSSSSSSSGSSSSSSTTTSSSTPSSGGSTTPTPVVTTVATPTPAITFTITVLDKQGQPVQGAEVSINGGAPIKTLSSGKATFSNLKKGVQSITIAIGKNKPTKLIDEISSAKSQTYTAYIKIPKPLSEEEIALIIVGTSILIALVGAIIYWYKKYYPALKLQPVSVASPAVAQQLYNPGYGQTAPAVHSSPLITPIIIQPQQTAPPIAGPQSNIPTISRPSLPIRGTSQIQAGALRFNTNSPSPVNQAQPLSPQLASPQANLPTTSRPSLPVRGTGQIQAGHV